MEGFSFRSKSNWGIFWWGQEEKGMVLRQPFSRVAPLLRERWACSCECVEPWLTTKQTPRVRKHKAHKQTGKHQGGESRYLWFRNTLDSEQLWSSADSCPAFSSHVSNLSHIQIASPPDLSPPRPLPSPTALLRSPETLHRSWGKFLKTANPCESQKRSYTGIAFTLTEKWVCLGIKGCFRRLSQSHMLTVCASSLLWFRTKSEVALLLICGHIWTPKYFILGQFELPCNLLKIECPL